MNKSEPNAENPLPDFSELILKLKKLRNDPRLGDLDKCYNLTKRNRVKKLISKIEKEGEVYTETVLTILENQVKN